MFQTSASSLGVLTMDALWRSLLRVCIITDSYLGTSFAETGSVTRLALLYHILAGPGTLSKLKYPVYLLTVYYCVYLFNIAFLLAFASNRPIALG